MISKKKKNQNSWLIHTDDSTKRATAAYHTVRSIVWNNYKYADSWCVSVLKLKKKQDKKDNGSRNSTSKKVFVSGQPSILDPIEFGHLAGLAGSKMAETGTPI